MMISLTDINDKVQSMNLAKQIFRLKEDNLRRNLLLDLSLTI